MLLIYVHYNHNICTLKTIDQLLVCKTEENSNKELHI